jgi:hypothetical protein
MRTGAGSFNSSPNVSRPASVIGRMAAARQFILYTALLTLDGGAGETQRSDPRCPKLDRSSLPGSVDVRSEPGTAPHR